MVSETWLVYGESTDRWVAVNYTHRRPEFTSTASRDDVNCENPRIEWAVEENMYGQEKAK